MFWAYSLGLEGGILAPWSRVSLRIAAAGELCKVTGEYFEMAKPFPRKELQNEPGNSAF